MSRSCISSNLSLTFPRHNLDHFFLSRVYGLTSIPGRGNVSHVITSFSNCMNSFLTYLMNLVWHSSVSCLFVIRHFTISRHRGSDCVLQSFTVPECIDDFVGSFLCISTCVDLFFFPPSSSSRWSWWSRPRSFVSPRHSSLDLSSVCPTRVSRIQFTISCCLSVRVGTHVWTACFRFVDRNPSMFFFFLRIELGDDNSVASVATTSVFSTVCSAFFLSI